MQPRFLVPLVASLLAVFGLVADAKAVTIGFSATDLPDVSPGENLYRYDYTLDGFPFSAGFGFSVQFTPTLFALLQSPPPATGSEWDIISLQPDVGLPDDGLYDARTLVSSPSQLSGFSVEFVWLGSSDPGAQPFTVYNASFAPIESGQTVPVQEPSTLTLFAASLVGLGAQVRRYARVIAAGIRAALLNRLAPVPIVSSRGGALRGRGSK